MEYSYQLYSSRNFQPWDSVFSMLQKAGYSQVEGISALYDDVDNTLALLTKYHLTMPTGHFSLDCLENRTEPMLEIAKRLGIQTLYCPFLPPEQRPDDADGYIALGKRLENAAKPILTSGLQFGWHNHDFEFQRLADGSYPIDRLFEGGPSLEWEADLAWIARGGEDPSVWLDKYHDRISAVHIKDIAADGKCADEDGWADVGSGTLDWSALLSQVKKTPAQYFILEHDNPSDDSRFATCSIEYLNQIW